MAKLKHTFHPTQTHGASQSASSVISTCRSIPTAAAQVGINVVVITDHVAVYVYTTSSALATYANAWIDASAIIHHQLPELAEPFGTGPEYTPGIIIRVQRPGPDRLHLRRRPEGHGRPHRAGPVAGLRPRRLPQHDRGLGTGQRRRQDHHGQTLTPRTRRPRRPGRGRSRASTLFGGGPAGGAPSHPSSTRPPDRGAGAAAARWSPPQVVHKSRIRPQTAGVSTAVVESRADRRRTNHGEERNRS